MGNVLRNNTQKTINFLKGSNQPLHQDSIHFYTEPQRWMVGTWTALQDMTEDCGPLTVVPAFTVLLITRILGSGSAPRSLIGGFVLMDHKNNYSCTQVLSKADWPVDVLICLASRETKKISSRKGMEISKRTSPLYQDWLDTNEKHISLALDAIKEKNMSRLEKVTEENCNFMHEVMKTSKPSIIYMNDVTHSCIAEIENLRASGHKLFYTIDAGPQIKIICDPKSTNTIKDTIAQKTDVIDIIHTGLGGSPRIIDEN